MFVNKDPNWVEPVTKSTDEVIVCTTKVCAVNVPATVNAFANDAVWAITALDADYNRFWPEIDKENEYGLSITEEEEKEIKQTKFGLK